MQSSPFTLEGKAFWSPDFPICVRREREFFTLPIHIHDFLEIQYVAEGKGFHYIGDERIFVEKGDLFIIPIGTRHVYRPASEASKDELIVYNCLFDSSVPDRLMRAYPFPHSILNLLSGDNRSYRRFKDSFNEAKTCMEMLYREYQTGQPGYEAILYARLTELLVCLYRLELSQEKSAPAISQLGKVFEYIEQNYGQSITLVEISALIPVSVSYMQRMFKQATGQSYTEYIQNLRVKKSCELLQQTAMSVKDIAAMAGYRDLKFFHELFRKKTGTTPREYRNKIKQSN
ncbi:AraC family transcriptional regulator [Cohnella sp. WQ 127256]|uniref:AraC family transcriptional regulator n=1 Tax=Cohnella sp. WQ 127256 TaxID=2938790 RepID=UPI0021190D14|nr:AraC family transcriptional regulator [Cohnella sp. WQ 127256]